MSDGRRHCLVCGVVLSDDVELGRCEPCRAWYAAAKSNVAAMYTGGSAPEKALAYVLTHQGCTQTAELLGADLHAVHGWIDTQAVPHGVAEHVVTVAAIVRDRERQGDTPGRQYKRRFSDDDAREVQRLRASGLTWDALALRFGCRAATLRAAVRRLHDEESAA